MFLRIKTLAILLCGIFSFALLAAEKGDANLEVRLSYYNHADDSGLDGNPFLDEELTDFYLETDISDNDMLDYLNENEIENLIYEN